MLYEVFPRLDFVCGGESGFMWMCKWFDVSEVFGDLCEEGGFWGNPMGLCEGLNGVVWCVCEESLEELESV